MSEPPEADDVDVFVSPRHFGGRTPAAKETFKKVQEERRASERQASNTSGDSEINFPGVKYSYDSEIGENGESVHKTVARNSNLSRVVLVANYLLVLMGIALAAIAIWTLLQNKSHGVFAYLSQRGFILSSPIGFGICFMVSAGGCIIAGFFIGVPHVAPSIVEGIQEGSRRRYIVWYQVLIAVSVILLAVIFFAGVPPLHRVKSVGITGTSWRKMALNHPDRICLFEIQNKCAGEKDLLCSASATASRYIGCPGHFCADTCKVASPRPLTDEKRCQACVSEFSLADELERCKASEAKKATSKNCLSALKSDVLHFLTVVLASSGAGIGVLLIVTMLGAISPILIART